jgi:hypothetical protein
MSLAALESFTFLTPLPSVKYLSHETLEGKSLS